MTTTVSVRRVIDDHCDELGHARTEQRPQVRQFGVGVLQDVMQDGGRRGQAVRMAQLVRPAALPAICGQSRVAQHLGHVCDARTVIIATAAVAERLDSLLPGLPRRRPTSLEPRSDRRRTIVARRTLVVRCDRRRGAWPPRGGAHMQQSERLCGGVLAREPLRDAGTRGGPAGLSITQSV